MKFFILSSLLLSFEVFAQVGAMGTPTGTGAGSGANTAVGSPSLSQNPQVLNPSPNPAPSLNPDGSLPNNATVGPIFPAPTTDVNLRQSMEEPSPILPTQPTAYPPVSNPGQPANVDTSGKPVIP